MKYTLSELLSGLVGLFIAFAMVFLTVFVCGGLLNKFGQWALGI